MNEVDFLTQIVQALLGDTDCFAIERSVDEKGVLLLLKVDKALIGRVIGKQGEHANAIRVLLRACEARNEARYSLKIVEIETQL